MSTGRYITLEGAEGCGKSTHAARLGAALDAVVTRETGGTAIGARIREILHDTSVTDLSHRAEALLDGQPITRELAAQAADLVAEDITALEDLRGSAEFRRAMVRVNARRTVAGLFALNDDEEGVPA